MITKEELQNKIDSIIDWLTDTNGNNAVDESDIKDSKIELKELKEQLQLYNGLDNFSDGYNEGFKDGLEYRTLKCRCGKE